MSFFSLSLPDGLFFFFISSLLALFSSIGVLFFRNPIYSIFSLILSFFFTGVTWLLLGAEFLSFVLLLVYIGAVMVLFLSIVMMLYTQEVPIQASLKSKATCVFLGIGFIGLFFMLIFPLFKGANLLEEQAKWVNAWPSAGIDYLKEISFELYNQYLFPFLLTGLLLLIAMIAAVFLTMPEAKDGKQKKKHRDLRQEQVIPKDRVELVDVLVDTNFKE